MVGKLSILERAGLFTLSIALVFSFQSENVFSIEQHPVKEVDPLSELTLAECSSTDEKARTVTIANLLSVEPARIEEFRRVRSLIDKVEEMHFRLVTPRTDWRVGHARPAEETDEAINFFRSKNAANWLSEGFKGDVFTQADVSDALLALSDETLTAHKRLLVTNALYVLTPSTDVMGSEGPTAARHAEENVIKLLSSRLNIELRAGTKAAAAETPYFEKRSQWATAAQSWLRTHATD